jgi:hypothetical protein
MHDHHECRIQDANKAFNVVLIDVQIVKRLNKERVRERERESEIECEG